MEQMPERKIHELPVMTPEETRGIIQTVQMISAHLDSPYGLSRKDEMELIKLRGDLVVDLIWNTDDTSFSFQNDQSN